MNIKDKIASLFHMCEAQTVFRRFMQYIINVLVVYIILVLSIGLIRILSGIKRFFINMPVAQTLNTVVTDILTFLVIIELFRSFIDYFEAHRFRLNTMIDPAIMFVIRELVVKLYDNQGLTWQALSGFGFLIVCLGIVRTLAVRFSPGDEESHRTVLSDYAEK